MTLRPISHLRTTALPRERVPNGKRPSNQFVVLVGDVEQSLRKAQRLGHDDEQRRASAIRTPVAFLVDPTGRALYVESDRPHSLPGWPS